MKRFVLKKAPQSKLNGDQSILCIWTGMVVSEATPH